MACSLDEDVARTVYLEPQEFGASIRRMERLPSANDSGIVDFHGSRSNNSKIGLSIPNDCYHAFDSDQENLPVTPTRVFYPTGQRLNGHTPVATQFSYPLCAPKSNLLPNELVVRSNRTTDDPNIYTSIDEAALLTFHGDSPSKSSVDSAPLVCSYQPSASRQSSVDSSALLAKGRVNLLYEPPRPDRRGDGGRAHGAGKAGPLSGKCCLGGFFNLIAVVAFGLALFQMILSSMDHSHEQLAADYRSLKDANEDLKQTQLKIENKFGEMLTERLRQLNDSTISGDSNQDSVSLLLFRLLINDSDLRRRLFDSFDGRMDSLKAEIESKVDSAEKRLEQLDSQRDHQLRMHVNGLMHVNMSACKYETWNDGTAATTAENSGSRNLTGKFVLRVFCTTDGGTEAYMEYNARSPDVYTCICKGQQNKAPSRYCILHYWTCPYI